MGCLALIVGIIAWAIIAALTDSGWLGFIAGIGAAVVAVVIAKRLEQHSGSPATRHSDTAEGRSSSYISHCWCCQGLITSATHRKCTECGWYICNKCRECGCRYKRFEEARRRRQ